MKKNDCFDCFLRNLEIMEQELNCLFRPRPPCPPKCGCPPPDCCKKKKGCKC